MGPGFDPDRDLEEFSDESSFSSDEDDMSDSDGSQDDQVADMLDELSLATRENQTGEEEDMDLFFERNFGSDQLSLCRGAGATTDSGAA